MVEEQSLSTTAWNELSQIIATGNAAAAENFLNLLPPGDVPYTFSKLSEAEQTSLLSMVQPYIAADILAHLADEQVADVIEELSADAAAAIFDEMDSDDQADVLAELEPEDAEAILKAMDPEEAAEARALVAYDPETAGGIMQTEYVAYHVEQAISDVISDMRANAEEYAGYDVRYVYVTDAEGKLRGVVRLRQLMLTPGVFKLTRIMIENPIKVSTDTPLEDLEDIFDRHTFTAVPVVDFADRLVGVVQEVAVEEALGEAAEDALLKSAGIIGGEELRTMNVRDRALRRMIFLVPMLFLSLISISVISLFEASTLDKVPAMGIFLPLVAGLCGSAGNQAMAVSLREMALGLVRPEDVWYVAKKEMSVGFINGFVLGVITLLICWVWRGNIYMGIVVGGALPLVMCVSPMIGGGLPLLMRRMNVDPAMASGPIQTTVVDLASFMVVLTFAYLLMHKLLEMP